MDLLSSFVENLSFIIQKETENSLGSLFNHKDRRESNVKDPDFQSLTIDPLSSSNSSVNEGSINVPEAVDPSKGFENLSRFSDLFSDLSECCQQIQELCFNNNFELFDRPLSLGLPFEIDDSNTLGIMSRMFEALSSELDAVFMNSVGFTKGTADKCIWSSLVLNDLQRAIDAIALDCSLMLDQKILHPSHIRLGRVYAWARDQSSRQLHGELNHVQKRLCRRLCNLVRLTRTEKRIARSHPFLVSLRHELVRIRTRVTGKLLTEGTLATGRITSTEISPCYEAQYLTGHSPVPYGLTAAFEKVIDQLLDIFMELPPHVPCLSLDELLENDGLVCDASSDRREKLRQLITHTVLSFYNQFDVSWADAASEQQQLPFYVSDADAVVSDDDEIQYLNVLTDLPRASDPHSHPIRFTLNPALVQTVLDRFDHNVRGGHRKRPMMHSSQSPDGEVPMSAVDSTRTLEEVSGAKRIRLYSEEREEICDPGYAPSPSHTDLPKELVNEKQPESNDVVAFSNELATTGVSAGAEGAASDDFAIDPTTARQDDQHRPSGVRRKAVSRSLRSRVARTPPSDASYSEGEVVSSDDEEEVIDSEGEAVPQRSIPTGRPPTPPELIFLLQQQQQKQQQQQQGQQDIPQQQSQQREQKKPAQPEGFVVTDSPPVDIDDFEDSQLVDTATSVASDIDLTELEIMDEWAPPGAPCLIKNSESELSDRATQVECVNKTASKEGRTCPPAAEEHRRRQRQQQQQAEEDEAARRFLLATDRNLSELVSQALATCKDSLESLILGGQDGLAAAAGAQESTADSTVYRLSKETEAAIERTAASLQEHVTAILANLLHAIPPPLDITSSFKQSDKLPPSRLSKRNQSQTVDVRNASRVRGMLRAYQQEAAKRLISCRTPSAINDAPIAAE